MVKRSKSFNFGLAGVRDHTVQSILREGVDWRGLSWAVGFHTYSLPIVNHHAGPVVGLLSQTAGARARTRTKMGAYLKLHKN